MKKVLSLVLALALVFSMSVCFAEEAITESNEEVMLISEAVEDAELISEEAPAEETVEEEATEEEAPAEEVTEGEAPAEEVTEAPVKEDGVITVKIDGVEVVFPDQKPILHNDRTMVPLRAIFEALGAEVAWDNDTNTAIAKRGDIYILVQIDNNKLIRNNDVIELDVPAMLLNDRTLVPVRAISEAFGCNVEWVEETLEVVVTTTPAEETPAEEVTEEETPAEENKEEVTEENAEENKDTAETEETVEETTEEEAPAEDAAEEKTEEVE